eukprot:11600-Chlamydomonas_euryale.AAC.1
MGRGGMRTAAWVGEVCGRQHGQGRCAEGSIDTCVLGSGCAALQACISVRTPLVGVRKRQGGWACIGMGERVNPNPLSKAGVRVRLRGSHVTWEALCSRARTEWMDARVRGWMDGWKWMDGWMAMPLSSPQTPFHSAFPFPCPPPPRTHFHHRMPTSTRPRWHTWSWRKRCASAIPQPRRRRATACPTSSS